MKPVLFFQKLQKIAIATTFAVAFVACNKPVNTVQNNFSALSADKIYEIEEVKDFVFACEEVGEATNKAIRDNAKKDFLKAIDLRENQKNNNDAIQYFKKAACAFPDANSYYELGSTLLVLQQYEEADKAFNLAEALRFTPLANLYFKKAQTSAFRGEGEYLVVEQLKKAVEQGFSDKSAIEKDAAFAALQTTDTFQRFYVEKFSQGIDKASAEFKLFLRGFPAATEGFEIRPEEVAKVSDKYISYEFASYVKEMETRQDFGREVGSEYFYVAKVKETPEYAAVLYVAKDAVAEDVPPVFTYLVTYDWKGKEISKISFACQCSPKSIKTGKIEGNTVTVISHERQWQAEFTEVPPSENKIKSVSEVEKKTYEIAANGQITETSKNVSKVGTQKSWFALK